LKNTLAERSPPPGKPLPPHVVVLDQRARQIRVADDGAAADDVGELEEREFAELGAVDRLAEPEADVLVGRTAQTPFSDGKMSVS
jgi:hypothetical protein